MPKAYRKPHITMNRVKYGNKVRPVKQQKPKLQIVRPSILDLKRIYAKLAKCASWQRADILAEAVQWYRTALIYVHDLVYVVKKSTYSTTTATQLTQFNTAATLVHLKPLAMEDILRMLKAGRYVCSVYGIKTPDVKLYLSKGKGVAKKLDKKEKDLSAKYDKVLTLFMQAYGDNFNIKVGTNLGNEGRRYDHSLNTLFYSPTYIKVLVHKLRTEGLLAVVLEEAWYVARLMAFDEDELAKGKFIVTTADGCALHYRGLLKNFANWARTNKDAPKNIIKRVSKKKPKKEEVVGEVAEG